jgi:RimJ/RimL family protein N-acetyltransferase
MSTEKKPYQVILLIEDDAEAIEQLFKDVWPQATEYPEEWRKSRILSKEEIINEMRQGYYYFGIKFEGKLAGLYKASISPEGCFGEHQSINPKLARRGMGGAMYKQFIEFAKEMGCKRNYCNILIGQIPSEKLVEKYGFRKTGEPYEQAKGMLVQMYEREVE